MRRRAASLALLVGMLALPWSEPSAQDYPSRTVRMIVPLGAGGPTDLVARSLADGLSNSLKQSFVVENRPGASGVDPQTCDRTHAAPVRVLPKPRPARINQQNQSPSGASWLGRAKCGQSNFAISTKLRAMSEVLMPPPGRGRVIP